MFLELIIPNRQRNVPVSVEEDPNTLWPEKVDLPDSDTIKIMEEVFDDYSDNGRLRGRAEGPHSSL